MSKQDMIDFSAVLTTLAEFAHDVPASSIYLGLGMDWHRYERCAMILAQSGLITRPNESTIGITESGRALAVKINSALAMA